MILIKLDVKRIKKDRIKDGRFLDLVCWEYKDRKKDKDKNDGYVKHSLSKEQREAGEVSDYVGSWKYINVNKQNPVGWKDEGQQEENPTDDGLPF